jgi:phosphoribosylaminoimidazole carboxylase PurE protein
MVVLILGSPSDESFGEEIVDALGELHIPCEVRIASAHKSPRHLLGILEAYEAEAFPKVYITVAGRSNALTGLVDAQVTAPVVACPPYSERFAGGDLLSSLRVPSGVAPAVVLEPRNAALLAAKILGLVDADISGRVATAQKRHRQRIVDADGARRNAALPE